MRSSRPGVYPRHVAWRLLELFFRLADALFLPALLLSLNRVFKPGTRRLNARETALASSIFGNTVDYHKVRVDSRAHIGCRQKRFAYVSFHLINCWGELSDAHFIHEMVHVAQFQRDGSVYIPRALWAQRTPEGYNYGGIAAIRRARGQGSGLEVFNYEQQGDVVADFFCLKNGLSPRWCEADTAYLADFESVVVRTLKSAQEE